MNNEFKKTSSKGQTVYTLESATSGGTSSGSIASVSSPMGSVLRRNPPGDNILAQEANKDKVPATTPRNFVAKNAKTGGAGAHKDKKKAEKQGSAKHKKPYMEALQAQLNQLKSKVAEGSEIKIPTEDGITMQDIRLMAGEGPLTKKTVLQAIAVIRKQRRPQGVAEGEQRMSRAAKGHEKYGKDGMKALAKAGRDGAGEEKLDKIRDKHDKYNEGVAEGSGPKEKQKTPYRDINSPEYRAAADKQKQRMAKDKAAEPGKKMLAKQGVAEVAGPEKCWPGHRKVGTKPGTGKNAGKRVNDCEKIGEQVVAEGFNGEYDDEAGMAQSNLHTMARAVKGLMDTIDSNDNLPEWCQEKIAKAEMMVTGVWDYLLSQKEQGIDPDVAEGQVVSTKTGLRHNAAPGNYGGSDHEEDPDIELDKNFVNKTEKTLGIKWDREKKRGGGIEVDPYFESLQAMVERSVSQAQHNLMVGAAHNPEFARKVNVKQQVGQEFAKADVGRDISKLPVRVPKKK